MEKGGCETSSEASLASFQSASFAGCDRSVPWLWAGILFYVAFLYSQRGRLMIRTLKVVLTTTLILYGQAAIAGPISQGIFELLNHPDGALTGSHGPYGLRLDSDEPPPGNGPTFSVEADSNPVTLTWNFDGTAVIEGRMLNNTTNEFWEVVYNMTGVVATSGGFSASASSGTLTYDDVGAVPANSPIALNGKQNGSGSTFDLFPDGHRLAGDNMTPVGRGWLLGDDNFNDWLVIAIQTEEFEIPEPSSIALLLVALTGIVAGRKRGV